MRNVQDSPWLLELRNFPRASTWPCTIWPPSRVTGVTERSRFTGEPECNLPSVERKSVSLETSAANESGCTSSAVRHTPLTAIESPSRAPSVTVRASMTMRASSPRFSTSRTRPSSSMIPVNMFLSVPLTPIAYLFECQQQHTDTDVKYDCAKEQLTNNGPDEGCRTLPVRKSPHRCPEEVNARFDRPTHQV